MNKMNLMILLLLAVLNFTITANEKLKTKKDAIHEALEKHVKTLASKEFSGRASDHEGLKLAAEYIIKEFKSSGVMPLPQKKKFQQEMEIIKSIKSTKEFKINLFNSTSQKSIPIDLNHTVLSFSQSTDLKDLEIVFAGYGVAKKNYNDYENINVKGKVALIFRYEPEETSPKYHPTDHANISSKLFQAQKNGAAGVILVNAPNAKRTQKKDSFILGRSRFFLKPDAYNIPMIQLERKFLKLIEDQTKLSFSTIQTEIDKNLKPNSFVIKDLKINMNCNFEISSFKTSNLIGFLPGNDPKLAKESIVIGAHYDHIGFGHFGSRMGKNGKNKLHPGADDNASGTAAIIEIAKILKKKQIQLKRNIIFILFTAEEMGLLGSNFFVNSEEMKKMNIISMINLDMIGNYNKKQTLRINGISSSKIFKPLLEKTDLASMKTSFSLYSPEICPSDHQVFFKKGIPSMHFFTGFSKHYHAPTDTFEVVKFDGLRKIVTIVSQFVLNLSTHKEPIKMNIEQKYNPIASVRNISFNRSKDNSIKKVAKNSPEAKAGLQAGDILLEVDYVKVNSYTEYYSIMRDRAIGETIQVKIKRDMLSNKSLDASKDKMKISKPVHIELEFIIKL